MLDLTIYDIDKIKTDYKTFSDRTWKIDDNKNLFRLVIDGRLNIAPCTIYKLDQLGLNHLEILEFNGNIGKHIHKFTTAFCDFLNLLQEQKGCVFAHDDKLKVSEGKKKYASLKLNHFASDFKNGLPMRGVALFNLDFYRFDYYDKKRK